MQGTMASYGFTPVVADLAQTAQPQRNAETEALTGAAAAPRVPAVADAAPPAPGATTRAIAEIQLSQHVEKQALLDLRRQDAQDQATKSEGAKILEQDRATAFDFAAAAAASTKAATKTDLSPGPASASAAESAERLAQETGVDEGAVYREQIEALQLYEQTRDLERQQRADLAERQERTSVYL